MIPLPCRQKGGSPLLGARQAGEDGPFGPWPDDGDDQDHDGAQHLDQPEPSLHMAQDS